jgi:hypothetical protein
MCFLSWIVTTLLALEMIPGAGIRRVIKLDYPYIFDYVPGTRRKDPQLEEMVTSPIALSGLLQIIAARAPFLCRSRRVYTRKRPEEMDEDCLWCAISS